MCHVCVCVCLARPRLQVKEEWAEKWAEKGPGATAHSLDKGFGPRLKYWMEWCEQHPEELNKVSAVQKKVGQGGEWAELAALQGGVGTHGGAAAGAQGAPSRMRVSVASAACWLWECRPQISWALACASPFQPR